LRSQVRYRQLSLPCFHHSDDQTEIEGVGWMLTLLAPQLVIDEGGYGQNGPTETFVFADSSGGSPVGRLGDYWEPIMSEKRPWIVKTLKRNRGTKGHPHILQLVKMIADSGIARVQFRIPHDDFDVAIRSKLR
jgi:hypothetical protein